MLKIQYGYFQHENIGRETPRKFILRSNVLPLYKRPWFHWDHERWNKTNWHKLGPIYNNQISLAWDLRDSGSQFDILKCLFSVKITLYQIHVIIYDQLVTFFGIKGPLNTKMTSKQPQNDQKWNKMAKFSSQVELWKNNLFHC